MFRFTLSPHVSLNKLTSENEKCAWSFSKNDLSWGYHFVKKLKESYAHSMERSPLHTDNNLYWFNSLKHTCFRKRLPTMAYKWHSRSDKSDLSKCIYICKQVQLFVSLFLYMAQKSRGGGSILVNIHFWAVAYNMSQCQKKRTLDKDVTLPKACVARITKELDSQTLLTPTRSPFEWFLYGSEWPKYFQWGFRG